MCSNQTTLKHFATFIESLFCTISIYSQKAIIKSKKKIRIVSVRITLDTLHTHITGIKCFI